MPDAETVYLFRHAVVRDAAYALHLPSERSDLHVLAMHSLAAHGEASALASELADHAQRAQEGAERDQVVKLLEAEKEHRLRAAEFAEHRGASAEFVEHMLRLADLPQPSLKARLDCLARAGSTLMGIGKLDRAERVAWRMNALAREAKDGVQEARSLRALMAIEATIGKAEQADTHLRQSLEILERLGDRGELASTLRACALHAMSRGRYTEAQAWIDRAMPYSDDNLWERGLILDTRGQLEFLMHKFEQALDSYRQSVELTLQTGNPAKARDTRTGTANCLMELGRLDEAESEARRLIEEFRRVGRASDESTMLAVLAAIELRRRRHDNAIAICREVLRQRRLQGGVWHLIEATGNLAEALCEAGRTDEALPHARESLRLSLEQDALSGQSKARWLLGWILEQQGDLPGAVAELTAADRLQEELGQAGRAEAIRTRLESLRKRLT